MAVGGAGSGLKGAFLGGFGAEEFRVLANDLTKESESAAGVVSLGKPS